MIRAADAHFWAALRFPRPAQNAARAIRPAVRLAVVNLGWAECFRM